METDLSVIRYPKDDKCPSFLLETTLGDTGCTTKARIFPNDGSTEATTECSAPIATRSDLADVIRCTVEEGLHYVPLANGETAGAASNFSLFLNHENGQRFLCDQHCAKIVEKSNLLSSSSIDKSTAQTKEEWGHNAQSQRTNAER